MIVIENFHHVSLSVTNLEKAKDFYGRILGFQEIERPAFDFPGAWYRIGDQQLHLIVHKDAGTLRNNQQIESKDGHFAIRVRDYDQTLDHLTRSGIKVMEKPNSKSGFAQIFCADPDNNLIEFNVDQEGLNNNE
ncbi:catechol 2,3-dioxygenase-like lactoylglutathione lyase family enzyme [Virgibacillus natechei]|uniref:Catechol 2,3-dioxygenase-like lactoylglutathione lyase family enzyme n=1 Tax=Virgibacillus natechei TaxID=1216297 RepID=A0ABS4IFT3_9BACI|nr:VOC family protein [Virgibacillus natechei]MBP1969326.1 catechol 2,3-dioxygenase-like lactoylglutathione lyase family enzyme [Virgibacillus natechei]UZD12478.1 VOC family protein [Virgibacillus natechei]